ncbi:MAG: Ig-like domain-containing protein [Flavobacteriaceae bacterium]
MKYTKMLSRALAGLFLSFISLALLQCAKRGSPTGGPKDVQGPVLLKAEPENQTVNFEGNKIRLYFDEYIKLEKLQEQLIVSPPLKYLPQITPQGGTAKVIEITLKDTLQENTTYTLNFGQSIVDNNEGNPNSFLTYVFSTGSYIDSLQLQGAVKDAFNKTPDDFISVMLYSIDSTFNDSTVYRRPPNYITNTLDSAVIFSLKNIKEGNYALFAIKDVAKNNIFDQNTDKIGFVTDTISLPTDSIYLLNLFREIPNYTVSVPSFAAKNKIIFGYYGIGTDILIKPLTPLPDSVRTMVLKERDKDSLDFWLTPFEADSIVFTVANERLKIIDTFTVKTRKVGVDSLILTPNFRGAYGFGDRFHIAVNTPITQMDTTKFEIINKDSIAVRLGLTLDSLDNKIDFDFEVEPNEKYSIALYPGAVTDFFGETNDTLSYTLTTKSLADFGNLRMTLVGKISYPLIVQLTDEKGKIKREIIAEESEVFEFNSLEPGKYLVRVIFDANENKKWDTGNYLLRIQPEKVSYYPKVIDMRANWEVNETFTILD